MSCSTSGRVSLVKWVISTCLSCCLPSSEGASWRLWRCQLYRLQIWGITTSMGFYHVFRERSGIAWALARLALLWCICRSLHIGMRPLQCTSSSFLDQLLSAPFAPNISTAQLSLLPGPSPSSSMGRLGLPDFQQSQLLRPLALLRALQLVWRSNSPALESPVRLASPSLLRASCC